MVAVSFNKLYLAPRISGIFKFSGDHSLFSAFSQEYREYTRGKGVIQLYAFKNVDLSYYSYPYTNKFSQSIFL